MNIKWTIGLPCYNNFTEVYFTIQALRLYHDMRDKEIVVVDNFGDAALEKFCLSKGGFNNYADFSTEYPDISESEFNTLVKPGQRGESNDGGRVRYVRDAQVRGVSHAKNAVFAHARGEFVLCMDSHILIDRGAFDVLPSGDDFIQGPCWNNSVNRAAFEWLPKWRANMWGTWGEYLPSAGLPAHPVEIWGMGAGFFACRRDSWLGFNPRFRGFGGETGYIQEKYRRAGRRVLCYPWMRWLHYFGNQGRAIPYPLPMVERVTNYILGFEEIGLDTAPIEAHFGERLFNEAKNGIKINNTPGN